MPGRGDPKVLMQIGLKAMDHPTLDINGRFLLQPVTGVQRVARELLLALDGLVAEGRVAVKLRVLLPAKGALVSPLPLRAARLERVGRLTGHAWEQLELPFHSSTNYLVCLGNTAPVLRLLLPGRPTLTMVHDLSFKYFPEAYSWKFKAVYGAIIPVVLRRSTKVVTVSEAEQIMIESHYPFLAGSGRFSFLANGGISDVAAQKAFQETPIGPEARGYGLYVGSLTKRKNAQNVLKAAVGFLRRYPDMRFVVIGATAQSFESVEISVPAEVEDRLEFRGQVNDAETIYEAYRSARFLLFPSFYESSGLPPTEAMTFGCPVVVSRIAALEERCGDAGLYCDPHDLGSIMDAVAAIMSDRTVWQRYSDAARARAAGFTWAAQAKGLLRLCGSAEA